MSYAPLTLLLIKLLFNLPILTSRTPPFNLILHLIWLSYHTPHTYSPREHALNFNQGNNPSYELWIPHLLLNQPIVCNLNVGLHYSPSRGLYGRPSTSQSSRCFGNLLCFNLWASISSQPYAHIHPFSNPRTHLNSTPHTSRSHSNSRPSRHLSHGIGNLYFVWIFDAWGLSSTIRCLGVCQLIPKLTPSS